MYLSNAFKKGGAFSGYHPRSHKVYGIICVSENDKILLVRGRTTGIWSLPKGHLKGNELAHDCAIRELYEETGLSFNRNEYKSSQKLYAGEYFIYRTNQELIPSIKDTNEVSEAGWYSLNELKTFRCNVDIVNMIGKLKDGKITI